MINKTSLISVVAVAAMVSATAHAQRGRDGHLNILYWQASSTVNPYLSGGTKDIEAASMVLDPLAHYDENGNMVPVLVEEIPTVENGGVASDLRSITWKLGEGIKWSDGAALTAHDVVFTGEYCLNEEMGCNPASYFSDVTKLEALDDHTIKIHFGVAKPFPYGPFVGQSRTRRRVHSDSTREPQDCSRSNSPILQKAQFQDCTGAKAPPPGVHRAEFRPHRHRPLQGRGVPRQRALRRLPPRRPHRIRANDVITYRQRALP